MLTSARKVLFLSALDLSLFLSPLANRYLLSVFSFYKYTYIYVSYLYYIYICICHLFQDESEKPASEKAATATGAYQVPSALYLVIFSEIKWIKWIKFWVLPSLRTQVPVQEELINRETKKVNEVTSLGSPVDRSVHTRKSNAVT